MLWSVLYKRESLNISLFHCCHLTFFIAIQPEISWYIVSYVILCVIWAFFGGILMLTLISLVLLLWKWWYKEECRPHCNTAVWRLAHWWYTMLYGGGWLIVDIQCCMVEASPLLIYNITWWRLGFCWYKNKRDMSL